MRTVEKCVKCFCKEWSSIGIGVDAHNGLRSCCNTSFNSVITVLKLCINYLKKIEFKKIPCS